MARKDEAGEFVAKYNKIVFPTEEDAERYYNERVTTRRSEKRQGGSGRFPGVRV